MKKPSNITYLFFLIITLYPSMVFSLEKFDFYEEGKENLKKAVEKRDLETTQKLPTQIFKQLRDKFVTKPGNASQIRRYEDKIKPEYIEDLLNEPSDSSIMKAAYETKNLDIIYSLLIFEDPALKGNMKQFYNVVRGMIAIEPNNDANYLAQKANLLKAIENNDIKTAEEMIAKLIDKIKKNYLDLSIHNAITSTYFNTKIWPSYWLTLLNDLLPAILKKQNFIILYILLSNRITLPTPLWNLPNFEALLRIKHQPIIDVVNNRIINDLLRKNSTINDLRKNFRNLFNKLDQASISKAQIEDIIFIAFTSSHFEWHELRALAKELSKENYIKDLAKFTKEYTQYEALNEELDGQEILSLKKILIELQNLEENLINQKDINGNSILIDVIQHIAKFPDKIELIEAIINKGADINQAGKEGRTPLMFATANREISTELKEQIISLLISKGANPEQQDLFGATALDYVLSRDKTKIAPLLHVKEIKPIKAILSIPEKILALSSLYSTLYSLAVKK